MVYVFERKRPGSPRYHIATEGQFMAYCLADVGLGRWKPVLIKDATVTGVCKECREAYLRDRLARWNEQAKG